MTYLCLVYFEENELDALPSRELDELMAASRDYGEELQRSGHLLVAHALKPVQTATTVRVRNGETAVADGPFAETKEQLGGFLLVNAKDLNDAIQVASKIPLARLGTVEVRPI